MLAFARFPATSVEMPFTTWLAPSVVTTTGAGHEATPLSASPQVNVTVTIELFQPAASGGGLMVPEIAGGVLSRFTVRDAGAVFPARSVAVPEMTWLAPSVLTVIGDGQEATPLVLSEHVKLNVTSELYQPAALGGAEGFTVMVGGS